MRSPLLNHLHIDYDALSDEEITLLEIRLIAVLESRKPRLAYAVALRYGMTGLEDSTFEEVGRVLGVSRARAQQLVRQGLWKIASLMSSGGIFSPNRPLYFPPLGSH